MNKYTVVCMCVCLHLTLSRQQLVRRSHTPGASSQLEALHQHILWQYDTLNAQTRTNHMCMRRVHAEIHMYSRSDVHIIDQWQYRSIHELLI